VIFPYKRISQGQYGPVVPLRLQGGLRWLLFNAFVDTGADYSVFHGDVASILGLKIRRGVRRIVTVGDGDSMAIYLHTVPVLFAGRPFEANIAFSEDLGTGFNLMGRSSFFEGFQFCFNDKARFLKITRLG